MLLYGMLWYDMAKIVCYGIWAFNAFQLINDNLKKPTGHPRECNILARQMKSNNLQNLIQNGVVSHEFKCRLDSFVCRFSGILDYSIINFWKPWSHNCNGVCIKIDKTRLLARYENLFAHSVADMRPRLSQNVNSMLIFPFFV